METLQIDVLNPKAKKLLEDLEALNLIAIRKTDYSGFQEILKRINEKVGENLPSENEIAAEVAEERASRYASKQGKDNR